jgi:hypothetical protein
VLHPNLLHGKSFPGGAQSGVGHQAVWMFKRKSLYQCQNFRDVSGGFDRFFDFFLALTCLELVKVNYFVLI